MSVSGLWPLVSVILSFCHSVSGMFASFTCVPFAAGVAQPADVLVDDSSAIVTMMLLGDAVFMLSATASMKSSPLPIGLASFPPLHTHLVTTVTMMPGTEDSPEAAGIARLAAFFLSSSDAVVSCATPLLCQDVSLAMTVDHPAVEWDKPAGAYTTANCSFTPLDGAGARAAHLATLQEACHDEPHNSSSIDAHLEPARPEDCQIAILVHWRSALLKVALTPAEEVPAELKALPASCFPSADSDDTLGGVLLVVGFLLFATAAMLTAAYCTKVHREAKRHSLSSDLSLAVRGCACPLLFGVLCSFGIFPAVCAYGHTSPRLFLCVSVAVCTTGPCVAAAANVENTGEKPQA